MDNIEVHAKDFVIRWVQVNANHRITWHVVPSKRSISFGVYAADKAVSKLTETSGSLLERLEAAGFESMVPEGIVRIEAKETTNGSLVVPKETLLGFVFDNTFSKSNAKLVQFSFTTEPATPGMDATESPKSPEESPRGFGFAAMTHGVSQGVGNFAGGLNSFGTSVGNGLGGLGFGHDAKNGPNATSASSELGAGASASDVGVPSMASGAPSGAPSGVSTAGVAPSAASAAPADDAILPRRRGTVTSIASTSTSAPASGGSSVPPLPSTGDGDALHTLDGRWLTGYLQKKRRKQYQGFTRRYFTLDKTSGVLYYYTNNRSSVLRGSMPIRSAGLKRDPKAPIIYVDAMMERWALKAGDTKTFDVWWTEFKRISDASKPDESEAESESEFVEDDEASAANGAANGVSAASGGANPANQANQAGAYGADATPLASRAPTAPPTATGSPRSLSPATSGGLGGKSGGTSGGNSGGTYALGGATGGYATTGATGKQQLPASQILFEDLPGLNSLRTYVEAHPDPQLETVYRALLREGSNLRSRSASFGIDPSKVHRPMTRAAGADEKPEAAEVGVEELARGWLRNAAVAVAALVVARYIGWVLGVVLGASLYSVRDYLATTTATTNAVSGGFTNSTGTTNSTTAGTGTGTGTTGTANARANSVGSLGSRGSSGVVPGTYDESDSSDDDQGQHATVSYVPQRPTYSSRTPSTAHETYATEDPEVAEAFSKLAQHRRSATGTDSTASTASAAGAGGAGGAGAKEAGAVGAGAEASGAGKAAGAGANSGAGETTVVSSETTGEAASPAASATFDAGAETSLYPLPHPSVQRRSAVPPPLHPPPSLLALLKNAKQSANPSAPIISNEPLSSVQTVAEVFENSELLAAASKAPPRSHLRVALVAVFAVARFAAVRCKERSARKPFTPLLGETYEMVRDDHEFRMVAEKVQHKPEVIVAQAESPHWTAHFTSRPHSKMWAKTMQLSDVGSFSVTFPDGEAITFNNPELYIRNILAGERYVEPTGTALVESSAGSHLTAHIEYKAGGMFSGRSEEVKIVSGDIVYEGKWTESLSHKNKVVWRAEPLVEHPTKHYGWTVFAAQLNEITPIEQGRLPPNDSRLRPDLRLYESQRDVEEAERIKLELEQHQRERRAQLEASGKQHEPFFFVKSQDSKGLYVLRKGAGNYWVQRQQGRYQGVPNWFK